jgi:hypothetical protein
MSLPVVILKTGSGTVAGGVGDQRALEDAVSIKYTLHWHTTFSQVPAFPNLCGG